jgi:cobalamin biosynthesis Mg chelatase CobN
VNKEAPAPAEQNPADQTSTNAEVKSTSEEKATDKAATPTQTPTGSNSATSTPSPTVEEAKQASSIEADRASEGQSISTLLPALILGGAMIAAYVIFYSVRTFRSRKSSRV